MTTWQGLTGEGRLILDVDVFILVDCPKRRFEQPMAAMPIIMDAKAIDPSTIGKIHLPADVIRVRQIVEA